MSPYEQLASIRRPLRFEGRPMAPRGRWVCFQATLNFWEHAQDVHAQNISSSMHISCPRNDTEAKILSVSVTDIDSTIKWEKGKNIWCYSRWCWEIMVYLVSGEGTLARLAGCHTSPGRHFGNEKDTQQLSMTKRSSKWNIIFHGVGGSLSVPNEQRR